MTKLVDYGNASLLFDEVTAPATPAAATVRLYAKADGLLYSKDDAGVETGFGSGDVAGPGTAIDGEVALFDTTSGKKLKGGGVLGTAAATDITDYATAAQGVLATNAEPAFSKGDLVAGTNVTLTGTLTGRLVGTGNITIDASGGGGSFTGGALTSALDEAKATSVASATTCDIGAATGNFVHITGTTTITGFGTVQAGTRRVVTFDSALTLTYNATKMMLPGNANIAVAANDTGIFVSEGAGNWRCVSYQRQTGVALVTSGGGLTRFTEGLSTSTPNSASSSYVSLVANHTAARADVAIVPKGLGAFSLAVANNSTTGGNKRGNNAVDLSTLRSAATMVASGTGAFQAGISVEASGDGSVALGNTAKASGIDSFAFGFAAYSTADRSVSFGLNADSRSLKGAFSRANGSLNSYQGECQSQAVLLRCTTNDATALDMTSDNGAASSSSMLVLPNYGVYAVKALVVATKSADTVGAAWEVTAVIRREYEAARTYLIGTPTITSIGRDAGTTAWDVEVSADTTNGGLAIKAVGAAATTIKWVTDVYSCVQVV